MLSVFTLEQCEMWDSKIRSFKDYDSYWLSGYVKAFKIHGDGEPLLFYYEDGDTRAVNVVMKRDIALDKHFLGKLEECRYFDFSTPYGYGGWLVEGSQNGNIFAEYDKWCNKNGIVSEFVRFHPVLKNHEFAGNAYDVVPLGLTVVLDLTSPDIIWANITSKNRNMIRKAQKNGIKIYNGRFPEIFENFRTVYNETMDKDHAENYYYFGPEFYESICDALPNNAQVFYAVYEEKIIAASIMLTANGRMNYHLSGSIKEYSNLAPTNLILYEAALWGNANGCKTLYLGGGVGSGEDSLFKFKKAFNRNDDCPRFYIGKRIINQNKYNELVALRNDISNESRYFPKYRV